MRACCLLLSAGVLATSAWACRRAAGSAQSTPPAPAAPASASPDPLARDLAAAVDAYRKIIVLLAEEAAHDAPTRAQANLVGRILYHQNRQRLSRVSETLLAELRGASGTVPAVTSFLDMLEKDADLHDADKLVFADVVAELADALRESKASGSWAPVAARLESDRAALEEIQRLYDKELDKIFGRFETRGMAVRREAWEAYVAFLKTRISPESVLKEYASETRAIQARAGGEGALETSGLNLPPRSLVLTFDDGPHPRYTDRILAILKKFGVKAVFFEVGQNLQAAPAAAASRRLLESGYPLANHSFSHAFLPKLSDAEIASEIERTTRLLREVSNTSSILFRAPYGARNERVLAAVEAHGLRSVLWNIDSRDWADPVPKSIANRAIQTVEGEKRGIILFHDIQGRTVEALPAVLETLQSRGYHFLSWNGTAFVDETPPSPPPTPPAAASLYRESWAVVIGIDDYKSWPKLAYAANDARGVQDLLLRRYHFKPEKVLLLLNAEATRERILSLLGDQLADPGKVQKEDRVFVFFAGHGITRRLPNGRSLGYIVPVDADRTNYQSQAISMTNFQDISEAIPAKHVFFVTDACYSGVALTRGGAAAAAGPAYLQEVTRRSVRQMLTAGGADQEVADNGPNGHSIFTWTLMQGLEGQADLNNDGYITASELATYVGPTVSSLSQQTPVFGNLVGSEGGEFVFELRHENEFLSELSGQLDQQGIQLNAELERIRAQIAEKRARNEKLQKELHAAKAELAGAPATPAPPPTAAARIDRGMALYREKRYAEALPEFEAAAALSPGSALAANNVGFTYYKLGKLEEAARWFQKTIALDPQRAIAHANLGDAAAALGRKDEARQAYARYLQLLPNAKNAADVRKKLQELE